MVRFSNGNGQPDPDGRLQPRGMALKLHPATADGQIQETDLVCMSVPVFMAQSAERVLEFEKAYVPRKVRAPNLLQRLAALVRMTPLPPREAGVEMSGNEGFLEWASGYEPAQGFLLELSLQRLPASYARTVYSAVHAFEVEGRDGTRRMVRFTFEPSDGVRSEGPPEEVQSPVASFLAPHLVNERGRSLDPDYLQAELRQRIGYAPSRFNLRMQIADPWDDTSDPTRAWPANRRRVLMGTLFLTQVLGDQVAGCEELSFNPGRLLPGMAPSDDPVLRQRVAVYEESYRRRMEARRQGCPVS